MLQGAALEMMLSLHALEESPLAIGDSPKASMIFSSCVFPTGMFTYPSGQC